MTGLIVTLFKSGDNGNPDNYRGITLNNSISKLYTLILNNRMTQFCENNNIIKDNQIGFRNKFRTADHVFTLKTLIDQSFAKKKPLYACFVDFKKAYDSVWREGLFLKLLEAGFSCKFVKTIQGMYTGLQSCVQLSNGISIPFASVLGLKQGCNLSPMLFNIFINKLIVDLDKTDGDAPKLGHLLVGCLLYADDLVLLSETKEGLQKQLDTLNKYMSEWFLEANVSKTKCITFKKGGHGQPCHQWDLGGVPIEECNSYCYLGVVFDKTGSLKSAYKALRDKGLGAMFSLIRNIYKHRTVSIPLLLELFDKLISPILLYNSEVWGTSFLPSNRNSAGILDYSCLSKHMTENVQLSFLKIILSVPIRTSSWAVISETGRYPLALQAWWSMLKFRHHINNSRSGILRAALETNAHLHFEGNITWYTHLDRILKFFNLEYLQCIVEEKELFSQILKTKAVMRKRFIGTWEVEKAKWTTSGKLDLFADLVDTFELADYLKTVANAKHRSAMTRMRVSAHKFPIETGRFNNIDRVDRECYLGCKVLGDEMHYMTTCGHPFMRDVIEPVLSKIGSMDAGFLDLDQKGKTIFMLGNKDPKIDTIVAKFSYNLQETFRELTF